MKNKFLILMFILFLSFTLFVNLVEAKTESNNFFNISLPDIFYNISLSRFGWSPTIPFQVCNTQNKEITLSYETVLHRIYNNQTEGSINNTIWEKQTSCRNCISNITFENITDCDYCGINTNYILFNTTILSKAKKEHSKTNQTAYNCKDFKMRFQTLPQTFGEYNLTMKDENNNYLILDPFWGNTSSNFTEEGVNLGYENGVDSTGSGVFDSLYFTRNDTIGLITWYNTTNDSVGIIRTNIKKHFYQGCFVGVNDSLYMISGGNPANDTQKFNISTNTNTTLANAPQTDAGNLGLGTLMTCFYHKDGVYTMGGSASNGRVYVYWINNDSWGYKNSLQNGYGNNISHDGNHGSTINGDEILYMPTSGAMAGYNISNNTWVNKRRFANNLTQADGTNINSTSWGRARGFFLNGLSFLFGGYDGGTNLRINETIYQLSNGSFDYYFGNLGRIGFAGNGTSHMAVGNVIVGGRHFGIIAGGCRLNPCSSGSADLNPSVYTFQIPEEAPSDTTPPNISIVNPSNNSVSTSTTIYVNYTYSTDVSVITYEFNSNNTNITLTTGNNITFTNLLEITYNITLYANDSSNNINQSFINFSILSQNPDLTIINPTNSTYVNTSRTSFNYSAIDNVELSKVWWQFNKNGTNVTITNNFTIQFDAGNYLLELWANDSSNNVNYTNVSIQVNSQSITSTLVTPNNNTILSNSTITFNCSATTVNLEIINTTFYWSGENGTFMANETISLTGTSNSTLFSRNITQKNYKWNCLFWSNSTFSDFADSNNTIIGITNTTTLSISISPTEPKLMNNLTIIGTASSGANTNVSWVNFTLIAPNGTRILDHINSSLLWNSSINKLDKNGTWTYFANSSNNYGKHADSEIGYITVSDIVSVNPPSYSRAVNVRGENWTFEVLAYHDTDENLSYNITFENDLDADNFTTTINTTNFVLTNLNTQFNPYRIDVDINVSNVVANGTYYGNITIRRIYDNRLIKRILVTAGVNPPAGLPLLSDNQFRVCSVNSSCDSIYYTNSGGGATYQNFWKFNNTGGFNLSDCQMQIYDSALNNDITSSIFAGFVLSPSNLVVEANNGSTISLYKSSLSVGSFYGRLDLNCTSDNFGHRTTLSSTNTSQMPIINITVKNPSGGGGAGGSTAGGGQPSANVTLKKEGETCVLTSDCSTGLVCNSKSKTCEKLIQCGDGNCDITKGENNLNCPIDCPTVITSGFWSSNPVIMGGIIIMISLIAYLTIRTARKRS